MKKNYIAPQAEKDTIHIAYSMLSTSDTKGPKALYYNDEEEEEYLELGESTGKAGINSAD